MFNQTQRSQRRQRSQRMLQDQTPMPVQIVSCSEGEKTRNGNPTIDFTFRHLLSNEEFNSKVLEGIPPWFISDQILDAVLPRDANDYTLDDLVGKCLMIQVSFNVTDYGTFINVKKALPLDEQYQELGNQLEQNEKQKATNNRLAKKEFEQEMEGASELVSDEMDEVYEQGFVVKN